MNSVKRCGAIYPWEMHALNPYEWVPLVCNTPLDRHVRDSAGQLREHTALGRFLHVIKWDNVYGQRFKRGGPNYREEGETL